MGTIYRQEQQHQLQHQRHHLFQTIYRQEQQHQLQHQLRQLFQTPRILLTFGCHFSPKLTPSSNSTSPSRTAAPIGGSGRWRTQRRKKRCQGSTAEKCQDKRWGRQHQPRVAAETRDVNNSGQAAYSVSSPATLDVRRGKSSGKNQHGTLARRRKRKTSSSTPTRQPVPPKPNSRLPEGSSTSVGGHYQPPTISKTSTRPPHAPKSGRNSPGPRTPRPARIGLNIFI